MTASDSVSAGALPIGLAHGVRLIRPVGVDRVVTLADLEPLPESPALAVRRETEAMLEAGGRA